MSDRTKKRPAQPGGTAIITDDGPSWDDVSDLSGAADTPDLMPIELPVGTARYELQSELARGNMGVIKIVRDTTLQRLVAIKELAPTGEIPNAAARFLDEARITAQLQHPGIVAVYDIGMNEAQCPFFAMQLIEGQTLQQILDGLRAEDPAIVRQFSRVRLLNIFMQVCMAVAYAHSRGVIHRDLKPENIMLGRFGEVFVMDWGLAKIVDTHVDQPVVGGRPDEDLYRTRVGAITGTPTYMSPEQAMGLVDALSDRTDIYTLGAILYELLIFKPPFSGDSTGEVLRKVRGGAFLPPSRVAPKADVPPMLESIIMRCMARDPSERYPSATALRDEVEGCIAGSRTVLHQVQSAARALQAAQSAGNAFRELARKRRRLQRESAEAQALRLPFDDPTEVARCRALRHQFENTEAEVDARFERAVAQFQQLLTDDPTHLQAKEGLRDVFWYRFLEAERQGARRAMALYQSLATQHDPRAMLQPVVQGDGALRVRCDATAQIWLRRIEAVDEIAQPGPPTELSIDTVHPLPMGSYVLEARREGHQPTRLPFVVNRQEAVDLLVRIPPDGWMPEDCVWVPAGAFWAGANNPELEAAPRGRQKLMDFALTKTPITAEQYELYLSDLVATGQAAIARRCAPTGWKQVQSRFHFEGHRHNPVTQISANDATGYARWRAQKEGIAWRLPTALEWEKAGRGVDGRAYPWGDTWIPGRARSAASPEGGALSPVDNPLDRSIYGASDFSGGAREWTATEHPRSPRQRIIKGGSYASVRAECHLAARAFRKFDRRFADVGFRLALDVRPP